MDAIPALILLILLWILWTVPDAADVDFNIILERREIDILKMAIKVEFTTFLVGSACWVSNLGGSISVFAVP